jgi:hypothetical protein
MNANSKFVCLHPTQKKDKPGCKTRIEQIDDDWPFFCNQSQPGDKSSWRGLTFTTLSVRVTAIPHPHPVEVRAVRSRQEVGKLIPPSNFQPFHAQAMPTYSIAHTHTHALSLSLSLFLSLTHSLKWGERGGKVCWQNRRDKR